MPTIPIIHTNAVILCSPISHTWWLHSRPRFFTDLHKAGLSLQTICDRWEIYFTNAKMNLWRN